MACIRYVIVNIVHKSSSNNNNNNNNNLGPKSLVGIATRYGLDGSGIKSRWGRELPHLTRPALGPTQPPLQWLPGLFPRSSVVGAWC